MVSLTESVVFAPESALPALGFVFSGVALGTVSGLVPGLHANNFALLLAAAAPQVPGPALFVGAAMLAAGVTHTFLDVVPALALGVPDAAMAASALPGHRLVVAGRGREALRLSALGSALAVVLAVPLALPMTELIVSIYPMVRSRLPLVLGGVALFLILTERSNPARFGGLLAFLLSAGLGWLTLDIEPSAPLASGGMLMPLFAGLFGAPVLIEAIDGAGVPEQADAAVTTPRRTVGLTALAGTLSGAVVGYLPGVSAAVAATVTLPTVPNDDGARGFWWPRVVSIPRIRFLPCSRSSRSDRPELVYSSRSIRPACRSTFHSCCRESSSRPGSGSCSCRSSAIGICERSDGSITRISRWACSAYCSRARVPVFGVHRRGRVLGERAGRVGAGETGRASRTSNGRTDGTADARDLSGAVGSLRWRWLWG